MVLNWCGCWKKKTQWCLAHFFVIFDMFLVYYYKCNKYGGVWVLFVWGTFLVLFFECAVSKVTGF